MNLKTSNNLALLVAEIVADLNIITPVEAYPHPDGKDLPCVKFGSVLVWAYAKGGNGDDLVWYTDLVSSTEGGKESLEAVFDGGHVLQAITAGLKYWLSYRLTQSVLKQSKHFPDFAEIH
jgi:hypothetical protein